LDPNLIAQLLLASIQVATQVIPLLSADDQAAVSQAVAALNEQVDRLHATAPTAVAN
jgi:hypothetical protein